MAITCLDVVNGALRKVGALAAGREARQVDRDDVFEQLKGLYRQLITSGTFGQLRDVVPTGASYTAYGNERIFRNSDATVAINLPQIIANQLFWDDYGIFGVLNQSPSPALATSWSNTTPWDCSVVVIADAFVPATFDFIYDGHQKLWFGLYGLSLTDEAPLAFRDPDGLKAMLATLIVDEFAGNLGPVTVEQARTFRYGLTNRPSVPTRDYAGVFL